MFYLHIAILHTQAVLDNYTMRPTVSRYNAASVSKERKNYFVPVTYTHIYTHRSVMLKRARSRLSTKITVASSRTGQSPSVIERFSGTRMYVRRVMAKKERRHCTLAILAEHTSLDSRFESNEGYILFVVSHLPMSYAGPFMSTLYGDIMFLERRVIIDKIIKHLCILQL